MYAPPAVEEPCTTVMTGMPAAESRARLRKIDPPWMKPSTLYLSKLAPADSTRCTNGSLFSSDSSCARNNFSRPIAWIAPASMPESLATIIERTPFT